jgi:hypothetical protein
MRPEWSSHSNRLLSKKSIELSASAIETIRGATTFFRFSLR